MLTTAKLAGFYGAHAIWCVSDGETLIPMLTYVDPDGQNKMERIADEDLGAAVEMGQSRLSDNPMDADDAALFYDARIKTDQGTQDAILIEMRHYALPDAEVLIAIPYTPADTGEFRMHPPELLEWNGCDDFEIDAMFQSFFEGLSAHEKGAEIWQASLDAAESE